MISSSYQSINDYSSTTDRRRETRYEIPLDAKLDIISEDGSNIRRVNALIINISHSGACVITDRSVKPAEFMVLQLVNEPFYTSVAVIAIKPAGAAVQRIHVQFLGNRWMSE
jgi:hypothetical protein